MRKSLNKIAFITGATGSIGSAISQLLYESGVDIALGYMQANETANEIISSWGIDNNCIAIKCDVSNRESVVSAFKTIHDKYGRIDYLVNNAAYTKDIPIDDVCNIKSDIVDKILDINLKGALWCCLEALKYMTDNDKIGEERASEKSAIVPNEL